MADIQFPCNAPFIIESKSLKLYFAGFNGTKFDSVAELQRTIVRDLSAASGATSLVVEIREPASWAALTTSEPRGICIDTEQPEVVEYDRNADLLKAQSIITQERLYSNLLRSICPVTGQPDWATISIEYSGNTLDRSSLVRYIASFRNHAGFHEECAETIFCDLSKVIEPSKLAVICYFTRRGGIDITPVRYQPSAESPPTAIRTFRQ